jgi:hypothetical protein
MIFGSASSFAIEANAFVPRGGDSRIYGSFRYWIAGIPVGDSEELILLRGSARYAIEFLNMAELRVDDDAAPESAEEAFARVYDRFYSDSLWEHSSLRERFHLDDIAMESTRDRYGIVAIGASAGTMRVLAKDLRTECVLADGSLPIVAFDETLRSYADWALAILPDRV